MPHLQSLLLRPVLGVTLALASLPVWAQTGLTPATTLANPPPLAKLLVDNPYGLAALWSQGDWIAKACLLLLALMSVASWAIVLSKLLQLRTIQNQARQAQKALADHPTLRGALTQLPAQSPFRLIGLQGALADDQHRSFVRAVDWDRWIVRAIEQALGKVQIQVQNGLALLATIGSTAPFVGLFGTVWAIYTALVKIGVSGQASIDRVAGPVGEALIMTAIGLAVAVPAVFGYNWLVRRNRLALEQMRSFGSRVHCMLLSDQAPPGAVARSHSESEPLA